MTNKSKVILSLIFPYPAQLALLAGARDVASLKYKGSLAPRSFECARRAYAQKFWLHLKEKLVYIALLFEVNDLGLKPP